MDPHRLYVTGVFLLFLFAAVVFPVLFFVPAPYGRHRRKGWGPEIPDSLGWVIQESPSVLLFAWVFFRGEHALELTPILLLALWQAHYVQRTYVFPFLLRGRHRRVPITTVGLAVLFNCVNAFVNAYAIAHAREYPAGWATDPRFVVGVMLFLVGYSINRHSDAVLRALRGPGEDGYKVPQSGLHRFVASPNYLGEILEWAGWAVASWSLAGLAFAVFTFANLAPRARSHLRWYRERFPDYPEQRRALLPGIW